MLAKLRLRESRQWRALSILCTFVLLHLFIADRVLGADAPPLDNNSLPIYIMKKLSQAAGAELNSFALPSPVEITDRFLPGNTLPKELGFLQQKPTPASPLVTFDAASDLSQALKLYAPDVIIGSRPLTPEQQTQLKALEAIIRDNQGNPTSQYLKYLMYEKKNKELRVKLQQAPSPQEASIIQDDIATNDQQWTIFGAKQQIEAALAQINNLSPVQTQSLKKDWLDVVANSPMIDSKDFFSGITGQQAWLSLSDAGSVAGLNPKFRKGPDGDPTPIGNVTSFSMSVVRVPVPNRYLSHPFVTNNQWKHKQNLMISSDNAQTSISNYVVTDLIVVKNLEVCFKNTQAWIDFSATSQTSQSIFVDNFTLKDGDKLSARVLPYSISWDRPRVVGVILRQLPTIPQPAENLIWSQ